MYTSIWWYLRVLPVLHRPEVVDIGVDTIKKNMQYALRTIELLFCQPRVEVTSCFVYKVMGLTFHDRINTQLIYKIEIAQVVARRITKPQRTFFRFESHWLLFFIHFFYFVFWRVGGRGRSDFIILFMSYFFLFIYFFIIFLLFFIPLTCIRYIYKTFCNKTSFCKFGNAREC